jgi:hypothetical protein
MSTLTCPLGHGRRVLDLLKKLLLECAPAARGGAAVSSRGGDLEGGRGGGTEGDMREEEQRDRRGGGKRNTSYGC